MSNKIEILDTTLRDGEQTPGVHFSAEEKFRIAQSLLLDLQVDRIEIGSALTSDEELQALKAIGQWAHNEGLLDRIEILGFADGVKSIDWLSGVDFQTINILCKASEEHCTKQLNKKPEEHFSEIAETIDYALSKGKSCNIYLEDWSRGVAASPDYLDKLMAMLEDKRLGRVYLCDTLGVLGPDQTKEYVQAMLSHYPDMVFELHCHNDYGLAVANCLVAAEVGIRGFHVTINGLGERAGNTSLESLAVCINDMTSFTCGIREKQIMQVSRLIAGFTGLEINRNQPVTGRDVFTHTSGVHADGQRKGNLYTSKLNPERFDRRVGYALGKLSGMSNLKHYLESMDITLDEEQSKALIVALKNESKRDGELPADKIQRVLKEHVQSH